MQPSTTSQRQDSGKRTFIFARNVRLFVQKLPKNTCIFEDSKQLVHASGSVGANYIEANEALSYKDKKYRINICRKEAKETVYWLKLIRISTPDHSLETWNTLHKEAQELLLIFSKISQQYKPHH